MRKTPFLVAVVLVGLVGSSAGAHIDLDKPEPEHIYLDNPWGGSPIVASEIGKTPQAMGDPETMNPVYGTCQMPGVVPSECTPDCAFDCDTPECSLNCFCGCNNAEKALHAQMLAQRLQTSQVLAARDDPQEAAAPKFGGDAMFWKNSLHALKQDEKKATRSAIALKFQEAKEKRKANPRFKAHQVLVAAQKQAQLAHAKERAGKRPIMDRYGQKISATRDPYAGADGFSWDKFHPVNPFRVRGRKGDTSPYAAEAAKMDDVFDPAEDWDNEGEFPEESVWWDPKSAPLPAWKLHASDHWWTHEPDGTFAAGTGSNPFGTYQNEHALGWF